MGHVADFDHAPDTPTPQPAIAIVDRLGIQVVALDFKAGFFSGQ